MSTTPLANDYPSIYFTALWLQIFNKELILERMDLVEEYINESYRRFIASSFNDFSISELDSISNFLSNEDHEALCYRFIDV